MMRILIEKSSDPIFSFAPEGQYTFVNRAFANGVGRKVEDIIGKRIWDIFPKDEADKRFVSLSQVFRTGEEKVIEVRVPRPDGDRHYVTTVTPVKDADGRVASVICSSKDITARKLVEDALAESEKRYRLLFESTRDGIVRVDINGCFVDANQAYHDMLGYTPAELMEKKDFYAVTPERFRDWEREEIFNDRLLKQGYTGTYEKEYIRKDGSIFPIEIQAFAVFNESREPVYIWGMVRDITERKLAEAERIRLETNLRQAMKMDAIGQLAGGVAHDFNNVLTGIIGQVSMALMDMKADDPLGPCLIEVNRAAESAAGLIRQLLAFSRKQVVEPKVLDLNEIIASLQTMLGRSIGENIELKVIPTQNLDAVKVDPGQFEQILVNLVLNARDAMPDGGKLVIETANVELDSEYCRQNPFAKSGHYVMFAVSDTGYGMTDDVKSHLFEPFFTTKPQGGGTGLGLATTYGAVKQADGNINVYSEEGHGTTFKIYLPAVNEKPVNLVNDRRTIQMLGGSETVLLVEDDGSVREMVAMVLDRLGYKVLSADNGASALVLAEEYKHNIGLLMTDVVMPGMNGREIAEQLIKIHPETKVLYTSGYTEDVIVHHGIVDEGLNFIGKPYVLDALARKLRQVLES
jgi:PAS domain S-box-containing protein